MSREALPPLFHPFDSGALDWPAEGSRVIMLGARADVLPADPLGADAAMVQGFRPEHLALQRRGCSVSPVPGGDGYNLALVLAGKHRGENEARLAEGIQRVAPGGLVVVAGSKTDGISSLRKRIADDIGVDAHLSKNHGEAFWLQRSAAGESWAGATLRAQADLQLLEGRFQTAPGMFSHDRVDVGSRLLTESLPAKLSGVAADFCAGWGYLSVALTERTPAISKVELFEADYASLEAAKVNMAALAPDIQAAFHWVDLASEPVERRFDVIVMNPPFHQGRAADPGIGHAMIRAASNALKPGGHLFMVANRGLPYEAALKKGFGRVEEIADAEGFKVWKAKR